MKYFLGMFVVFITMMGGAFAESASSGDNKDYIRDQLFDTQGKATVLDSVVNQPSQGLSALDAVLKFLKDSLYSISAFMVIATFLYMGIRLIYARGNPDDFKKVMTQLVYVVIGIFVISGAFALVKLVASLNIS